MFDLKKFISFLIILLIFVGVTGCAAKSAEINPRSAVFSDADVVVTLDPGSYKLKQIVCNDQPLAEGDHYKKDGNTITFPKEFLAELHIGDNLFTFEMSGGENPGFILTVSSPAEDKANDDTGEEDNTDPEDNLDDYDHWEEDNYDPDDDMDDDFD